MSGVMVKSFLKTASPRRMDFVALRELRDFRVNLRHLLWQGKENMERAEEKNRQSRRTKGESINRSLSSIIINKYHELSTTTIKGMRVASYDHRKVKW